MVVGSTPRWPPVRRNASSLLGTSRAALRDGTAVPKSSSHSVCDARIRSGTVGTRQSFVRRPARRVQHRPRAPVGIRPAPPVADRYPRRSRGVSERLEPDRSWSHPTPFGPQAAVAPAHVRAPRQRLHLRAQLGAAEWLAVYMGCCADRRAGSDPRHARRPHSVEARRLDRRACSSSIPSVSRA
jgi:hypothetical protein